MLVDAVNVSILPKYSGRINTPHRSAPSHIELASTSQCRPAVSAVDDRTMPNAAIGAVSAAGGRGHCRCCHTGRCWRCWWHAFSSRSIKATQAIGCWQQDESMSCINMALYSWHGTVSWRPVAATGRLHLSERDTVNSPIWYVILWLVVRANIGLTWQTKYRHSHSLSNW